MKKFFMMAAIVLFAATSCTNESVNEVVNNNAEQTTVPVRVRVSDFSISMEEFPATRATQSPTDYTAVGALTLAFYDAEGTEVYKTTQYRFTPSTYTTFGEFSTNLQVGHYTMVALGYSYFNGDVFVLTSPTQAAYTSEKPRETFSKVQSVTVTNASPLNLSVTLDRISSLLKITSTDGRPASATKVRTTIAKGGKAFNPTTGLATTDGGFAQTNSPSTAVGTAITVSGVLFLSADEETMNVTIQVLDDDDNVLSTRVVNNVPLKRNRQTTLSGAIFTADESAAAFQLETEWLEANTVDF